MRAIVNTGPNRLELLDRPTPEPGAGQVRIRVGACGVCATDLAMIAGWDRTDFGSIPGHEWSGTVDAVGPGGDEALVGRRCVAENVLSDGGEVGFEHPGAYAEYLITEEANVYVLPEAFPFAEAALIEPLAVCVRGVRRLAPDLTTPILVFGDGPIGLLMLLLLRDRGAAWTALVGGRQARLSKARQLGASRTVNYHEAPGDLSAAVREACGCEFPSVIEASGSASAMSAALRIAAPGGKVLVLGDYGLARADFLWNDVLIGEIELIGSNASAGGWPEAVELPTSGRLPLSAAITHRLPADRFGEGIDLTRDRHAGAIKVVLEWG